VAKGKFLPSNSDTFLEVHVCALIRRVITFIFSFIIIIIIIIIIPCLRIRIYAPCLEAMATRESAMPWLQELLRMLVTFFVKN
jgi:hypothetical protein